MEVLYEDLTRLEREPQVVIRIVEHWLARGVQGVHGET